MYIFIYPWFDNSSYPWFDTQVKKNDHVTIGLIIVYPTVSKLQDFMSIASKDTTLLRKVTSFW